MIKIKIKNTPGIAIPCKKHDLDACYDITAISEPVIAGEKIERPLDGMTLWKKIDYIEYDTGLEIQSLPRLSDTYHVLVFPRSSISKTNLVLANGTGIIDYLYTGRILLRYKYIFPPEDLMVLPEFGVMKVYGILNREKIYHRGERCGQIKVSKNIQLEFESVEKLNETPRGSGGFGSTGV